MPSNRLAPTFFVLLLLGSLAAAQSPSLSYPNVTFPPENPFSSAKAVLGKILFWDEQLSSTNTIACGTCHIPGAGGSDPRSLLPGSDHPGPDGIMGTSDDTIGSRGVVRADHTGKMVDDATFFPEPQRTGRKSPSMIDSAFFTDLFWDGRARSQFVDPSTGLVEVAAGGALESQAVGPILSDVEMAHESRDWPTVIDKITRVKPLRLASNLPADITAALALNPDYPSLFNAAFGTPVVSVKRIAFAIATYERTLVADRTPWDLGTLTPQQALGNQIFNSGSKGRCAQCHSGPLFSDDQFHTIGVRDPNDDVGRMAVTGLATDLGAMKTPSMRNVGLRSMNSGRLFHNGDLSGADMNQIIAFYQNGGAFPQNLDPLMQPLNLTANEVMALEDFLLNGLTDPRVANETGPFSRPTLMSEAGIGLPTVIPGTGFADSNDVIPQIIANQPASLQHPHFTIGVSGTWGGMDAYLVAGSPNTNNDVLFGFVPLGVGFGPMVPFVHQLPLEGFLGVHGTGYGSVTTSISNNPYWAGITFHAQWIVTDPVSLFNPNTNQLVPGLGISLTDAVSFTVLP